MTSERFLLYFIIIIVINIIIIILFYFFSKKQFLKKAAFKARRNISASVFKIYDKTENTTDLVIHSSKMRSFGV